MTWLCGLCARPITFGHFKRHLNLKHAGADPQAVNAEWIAFLDATGWPRR